jgi:uncharacterized membrane protein
LVSVKIQQIRRSATLFLALLGITIAIVLAIYFYKFHGALSSDPAAWGQMGDFFGGILNPILGFCSFVSLLLALVVQAGQLETASAAFAQSQRESAKSNEDFLACIALVNAMALSLREQTVAARTGVDILALAHSLVVVNESIKEEESHVGVLISTQLNLLRDQRVQLTARLLQITQNSI